MKDGFYCVSELCKKELDLPFICECETCNGCEYIRRKHETPEQFKERTGRDWPEGWAAYALMSRESGIKKWIPFGYVKGSETVGMVVLANTDFGPPEGDFEGEK